MRKINSSYRQIAICLILLSCSLVIIHSCKKDRDENLPLTKTELIAEAKSFFEDEIINLPQLNDNNFRHSLNKTPLWDKASTRKISIGDAVIVPIKYEKETLLKPEGEQTPASLAKSSYLMIYKNKQQEMQAEWVTVIADKTISNGNKFVGTIAIEDWNGKFKRGFAFGAEGDILPVYLNSATTYKKISYARSYTCFTIEHYGYVMGYPQIVGTETFCFSFGGGNNGAGNQWHENGVENDGNGTEPTDYSYIVDCDNVINGTATWNTDCQTCIGGTTGLTECPQDVKKADSLKNNYPCLDKLIFNKLATDTGFRKLLWPFQGKFTALPNITYTYSSQPWNTSNYSLGNTEGNNQWSSTINLNKAALTNASQLFIAVTLIHETAHAYSKFTIVNGVYGNPIHVEDSAWPISIIDFARVRESYLGGASNYIDHATFMEDYFDNMVNILTSWGGNSYTEKEYRMAVLYGLNNAGQPPSSTNSAQLYAYNSLKLDLLNIYENIKSKYSITSTELNAFYSNNIINTPNGNKLPTTCP